MVNKPCNSTALADFLYYFAFIYLVFLIFNTVQYICVLEVLEIERMLADLASTVDFWQAASV